MATKKLGGLGRGLGAIYYDDVTTISERGDQPYEIVSLDLLQPGASQPRTQMSEEGLSELAESIRQQGIISPIVVRKTLSGRYEIIAGERRFRAAKLVGLSEVPVIVRTVDDRQALAMALIENIQRENLNPLEEALGIQRLIEECSYTHEQAAEAIGRSRTTTSNLLRLLNLTHEVKAMLLEGTLEMGHARALLPLDAAEQILVAKEIATRNLSVRQAEDLVKKYKEKQPARPKVVIKTRDDLRLEETLAESLGAVVKLTANQKGKGKIVIEFSSLNQLQGIVDKIQDK